MLHSRLKRVQSEYQEILAKIIAYDLSDPRVEFTSVTGVQITKDLRDAIVHVSLLNDDPEAGAEALAALESAKGYIKRLLAKRISLKRLPDPHFRLDTSGREAFKLFHIMEELRKEESPNLDEPENPGDENIDG
jgi:ribosome-binding factor A